jgi:AraC family transcriptional regulator, glycine betaine-responsive activator
LICSSLGSWRETNRPRRFVFLLLDRFTMLSFAGAIEPLRIANRVSGRPIYEWQLVGEGGATATCSNGAAFQLDMGLGELDRDDTLLVCGGIDMQKATTKSVIAWLRREARRGIAIGGLCTGSVRRWRRPASWMARRQLSTGRTRMGFWRSSKK